MEATCKSRARTDAGLGAAQIPQVASTLHAGAPLLAPLRRTHLVQMPRNNAHNRLRETAAAIAAVLRMRSALSWRPVVRDLLPPQQAQDSRIVEWRRLGT